MTDLPPGRAAFRNDLSPADAERLWRDLPAARRRRTTRRAAQLGAVLALAVVAVLSWRTLRGPAPLLELEGGAPIAAGTTLDVAARPVVFADGSRITALADATSVQVVTTRADRFVTLLQRGSIAVEVTPGGPREWVVETDLATIQVVGTGFDVIRDARGLEVRVRHGIVVVSGERVHGRLRRLTAGESLRVTDDTLALASPDPTPPAAAPAVPPPAVAVPPPAVAVPPPAVAVPPPAVAVPPPAAAVPPPAAAVPPPAVAVAAPPPASPPPADAGLADPFPATADAAPAPVTTAPTRVDALLDRFAALRRAGRSDDAIAALAEALADPRPPAEAAALRLELGRYEWSLGRIAEARAVLRAIDGPGVPPELRDAARALLAPPAHPQAPR